MEPDIDAWEAWHPRVVAERLAELPVPWYVAGGWALDLFRSQQTRPHADLEIAIPGSRFAEVAARFEDCAFYVADHGRVVPMSPVTLRDSFQTWAWDIAAERWRFDIMREPQDDDGWVYRRDRRIRRPYTQTIGVGSAGIPYLMPEIVLLFKSKDTRNKDHADFESILPALDVHQRTWLLGALDLVAAVHPWRAALAATL